MSDFKVGDWVKCVDSLGVEDYLIEDEYYKISKVEEYEGDVFVGLVGVITEIDEAEFFADRFIFLQEQNDE